MSPAADMSLLNDKLGFDEVVNYFSGSPLNRLSFLRHDRDFLRKASTHPTTRYLLLKELDPLAKDDKLCFVTLNDVEDMISGYYEGTEENAIDSFNPLKRSPALIFLGIDESDQDNALTHGNYTGRCYFALEIDEESANVSTFVNKFREAGRDFRKVRVDLNLQPSEAAILAHARSLVDWNTRNKYCSACGNVTLSLSAGAKRHCVNPNCVTAKGLHNQAFPRTDPTVIMATINAVGTRILLGRQKRWPPRFYSCLAGFVEPGESIEEAVRRETYEESGVKVGR